jgi:hypothetical protein
MDWNDFMSVYITNPSNTTSIGILKNEDNWFVFNHLVFYLEVWKQKVEIHAFSFSDL